MRLDRPTQIFGLERFRLAPPDRPTRRAQRREAKNGSDRPTDRPNSGLVGVSGPSRFARPTDPARDQLYDLLISFWKIGEEFLSVTRQIRRIMEGRKYHI